MLEVTDVKKLCCHMCNKVILKHARADWSNAVLRGNFLLLLPYQGCKTNYGSIESAGSGVPRYAFMFSGVFQFPRGMVKDQEIVDQESSQLKKLME